MRPNPPHLLYALLVALTPAAAAPGAVAACALQTGATGMVARVADGETVILGDGTTVRLIGALAPQTPSWWTGRDAWPPAQWTREALADLAAGRPVELRFPASGNRRDRRGRRLAQLFVRRDGERIWVQGYLVERGYALSYSLQGNHACARRLQARERHARETRSGLWRRGDFSLMPAEDVKTLSGRLNSFQIVTGRVKAVGRTRRWTFLNFGPDWRRDFTVAIRAGNRRHFEDSDVAPERLEGRRVRVRGWIGRWNGPVIKATHPQQIELVEKNAKPPPSGGASGDD